MVCNLSFPLDGSRWMMCEISRWLPHPYILLAMAVFAGDLLVASTIFVLLTFRNKLRAEHIVCWPYYGDEWHRDGGIT